jgi:hypothetical protein
MNKSWNIGRATKKQTSLGGRDELLFAVRLLIDSEKQHEKSLGMLILMTVMCVAAVSMKKLLFAVDGRAP